MANFNYNKIILGGRLTADPELKQTQTGVSVVSFGLAVNRRYSKDDKQPKADFFNVTAWRDTAEFIAKYFRKGSSICITGTVQNRTWVDAKNVRHYATDVIAEEASFVDASGNNATGMEIAPQNQTTAPTDLPEPRFMPAAPSFEEVKNDDDLPF